MSERNERILNSLRVWGRVYISTLCADEDAPEASIRRSIQELRREGHLIDLYDGVVSLWK